MRAIRFHRTGGPDVLALEEVDEPAVRPGCVVISVRAIGVNYADLHFRKGDYFIKPRLPDTPGMEAAGEILEVGAGVTGLRVGQRVMAFGAAAYAEKMLARASHVYALPDAIGFEDAAALPVQGLTAMHVLSMHGRLAPGEGVLVHAAAGGVGALAVQIARLRGAKVVIGTASTPQKQALALQLGADACFAAAADFPQRVKEATSGAGVDVVLEMLGGAETYKRNLACLAPFGRMVVYGAAGGDLRGTFEPVGLMGKNLTVTGYYLTSVLEDRGRCEPELMQLADWVATGAVKIVRGAPYRLAEAATAHEALASRGSTGKLVLVP